MARIRQIKPEIWIDERVRDLSRDARLLYIGLITQADDEGRQDGRAPVVRSLTCPADDVSTAQVNDWITEIATAGLALLYGDRPYLWLPKFTKHQYIQRPKPSVLPAPTCPAPADEDPSGEDDPARAAQDDTASTSKRAQPSDMDIGPVSDPPRGRVDFLSSCLSTEAELPLTPPTPEGENGSRNGRLPTVDHIRVTPAELELAEQVLAEFNRQRQLGDPRLRDLGFGKETRNRIIRCIRVEPGLTLGGHAAVIAASLANPYWDGHPGVEHLYRPDLFERALQNAEAPPTPRAHTAPTAGPLARAGQVSDYIAALRASADADEAAELSAPAQPRLLEAS